MPIVGCSYSFAITDKNISEEDRLAALKKCAEDGCIRCTNAMDPGPIEAKLLRKCKFKHPSLIACIKANDHLKDCGDDGYCKYCGEQVEALEPDDHAEEEEMNEPGELEISLNDSLPHFTFQSVLDSDQERVMQLRSWELTQDGRAETGIHLLLADSEDVYNLFQFTHDWLRAGNLGLPVLELRPRPADPPSIDVRAVGRRTISIAYDYERDAYVIHALVGNGAWKEMVSVPAQDGGKEPSGLTCPECQSGPCYPDSRDPAGYFCGHCDMYFTVPDRPHAEKAAKEVLDEGEPPAEVMTLSITSLLRAEYDGLPDEDGDDPKTILRQVIALGRPRNKTSLMGCVLNDAGRLVIASSLPRFRGMSEDE